MSGKQHRLIIPIGISWMKLKPGILPTANRIQPSLLIRGQTGIASGFSERLEASGMLFEMKIKSDNKLTTKSRHERAYLSRLIASTKPVRVCSRNGTIG